MLLFAGFLGGQGIISIYSLTAGAGFAGFEAKQKYEEQTSGDLSLLQSGRSESLVSIQAIADSPILGHGSWAKDVKYVAMLVDSLKSHGIVISDNLYLNTLIPSHSHLAGSWVEAGVLGGVFWIAVLIIAVIAFYRAFKLAPQFFPIVVFSLVSLLWDVLFSPFGGDLRFTTAAKLCLVLSLLQVGKNSETPSPRALSRTVS